MRKSATNDDVLSTREAAERLGVALRTVQLWVEGGVLPAWKTAGGHRRISRAAVERLIEERRQALSGHRVTESPRSGTRDESRMRMLVVEDDPDLLKMFSMVIESWELPIDLTTAADGFEALLRIGENCPDLLLTDLNMPGMDGFRMISSLRGCGQAYEQLEIIAVTALSADEIADRGGLPTGVPVFTKPVSFDELETLVRDRLAAAIAAAA